MPRTTSKQHRNKRSGRTQRLDIHLAYLGQNGRILGGISESPGLRVRMLKIERELMVHIDPVAVVGSGAAWDYPPLEIWEGALRLLFGAVKDQRGRLLAKVGEFLAAYQQLTGNSLIKSFYARDPRFRKSKMWRKTYAPTLSEKKSRLCRAMGDLPCGQGWKWNGKRWDWDKEVDKVCGLSLRVFDVLALGDWRSRENTNQVWAHPLDIVIFLISASKASHQNYLALALEADTAPLRLKIEKWIRTRNIQYEFWRFQIEKALTGAFYRDPDDHFKLETLVALSSVLDREWAPVAKALMNTGEIKQIIVEEKDPWTG